MRASDLPPRRRRRRSPSASATDPNAVARTPASSRRGGAPIVVRVPDGSAARPARSGRASAPPASWPPRRPRRSRASTKHGSGLAGLAGGAAAAAVPPARPREPAPLPSGTSRRSQFSGTASHARQRAVVEPRPPFRVRRITGEQARRAGSALAGLRPARRRERAPAPSCAAARTVARRAPSDGDPDRRCSCRLGACGRAFDVDRGPLCASRSDGQVAYDPGRPGCRSTSSPEFDAADLGARAGRFPATMPEGIGRMGDPVSDDHRRAASSDAAAVREDVNGGGAKERRREGYRPSPTTTTATSITGPAKTP